MDYVSSLTLEAAAAGLIDLRPAAAEAISAVVRMACIGIPVICQPRPYHVMTAKKLSRRGVQCQLNVARDTVTFSGALADGVAISGARRYAVLHLKGAFPETLAAALVGMPLDKIVSSETLPFGNYRVLEAEVDEFGLTARFLVPRIPLSGALAAA